VIAQYAVKGFQVASRTHARLRESNQDVHLVHAIEDTILLVVCDGMGGVDGGERAARVCAEAIRDHLLDKPARWRSTLPAAMRIAHERVRAEAEALGLPEIGTTAVAAVIDGNILHAAWVGDSRLGVLTASGFRWLTRDHVAEPGSAVLTRAIGIGQDIEPEELTPRELAPGDTVMVCSDGVHGAVQDHELFEILSLHGPEEALDRIDLVLDRRLAEDNATAVVFQLTEAFDEMPTVELPKMPVEDRPGHPPEPPAPYRRTPMALVGVLGVLALAALTLLLLQRLGGTP